MKQIEQQNKRVSPSPQKGAITERGLFRLMLPSLLGILLCSTCLAGLTWACFSDSVTSRANTITAATFTVEVTITEITGGSPPTDPVGADSDVPATNEEGGTDTRTVTQPGGTTTGEGGTPVKGTPEVDSDPENKAAGEGTTTGEGSTSAEGTPEAGPVPKNEAAGEGTLAAANSPNTESETDPPTPTPNTTTTVERNADGSYTLTAGKKYTVTLTASGTATGYCNISFGDKEYHTVALAPNETISFTVCASEAYTSLTIAPQWGTYHAPVGGTDTAQIGNNGSIGTSTTDDNATEQADSPAVAEPSADTDETLSGETGQSNEQTNNGETAGGTTENTTADTNDETTSGSTGETAETTPGESDETTGMSTDGDEEPANEGTDTEKANSEPSADEPTDTPSEGQSEE